jgi:hypothetical protein
LDGSGFVLDPTGVPIRNGSCFTKDCIIDNTFVPDLKVGQELFSVSANKNFSILQLYKIPSRDQKLVKFSKNCFGKNQPDSDTVLTENHLVSSGSKDFNSRRAGDWVNSKNITFQDNNETYVYHVLVNSEYNNEMVLCNNMVVDVMGTGNKVLMNKLKKYEMYP